MSNKNGKLADGAIVTEVYSQSFFSIKQFLVTINVTVNVIFLVMISFCEEGALIECLMAVAGEGIKALMR